MEPGGHQRAESIPVTPGPRGVQTTGAPAMIAARRLQRHFADGFIAEAVEDLWEPWMRHADAALEDDALLLIVQQELAKRCKKSKTRGRKATPADVVPQNAAVEACARLELRSTDAGSARQSGLSRVYPDRRRKGSE